MRVPPLCGLAQNRAVALLDALWGDGPDRPDQISVAGETTSRISLAERASATAARIGGAGAVAVHGSATLDTVVAVVAALTSGVAVVPLADDVGPAERDHVLHDSGVDAVLGSWPWDDTGLEVIPLASGGLGPSEVPSTAGASDGSATALVMYTSGTTGPPKGVVLSHRALAADLDGLADAWQWTPDDHLVHGLPLYHVHGLVL